MSMAKKVFAVIFGLGLGFGALVGIINLVFPEATSITMNGQNVEGVEALWTAMLSGGVPGLIFGLIGAGIAALFSRKKGGN